MNIQFVIPTYKRAGKMVTNKWLRDTTLAVVESQVPLYKAQYGEKILTLPEDVKGNMAKTRNAILEWAFNGAGKADVLVMMDDDIAGISYYQNHDSTPVRLTSNELYSTVAEWSLTAKELGTVLFGVNLQSDPKFYREYTPISFLSPVLCPFYCLLPNPIRFDERLSLNEDYDYFLQVVRKYRKVLRYNGYHYQAAHINMEGGCATYRTLEREKKQAEIFQRKWGSKIVSFNFDRSINPRVRVPLKGI